jgi:hypothetical protein
MHIRKWCAALAGAAVAVGAVVVVATQAQAAVSNIQVREITGSWNVNAGATSTNALVCAAGEKVLQGGILSQTLSNGVFVLSSFSNADNRWFWQVYNDTFSTQEIHARAICATGVEGWSVKWGSGQVFGGTSGNVDSLSCPSGKTSIGGGWNTFNDNVPGRYFVSDSLPVDKKWRVRVRSNMGMTTMSVQAICTSQTGRTSDGFTTTVNPGSTAVGFGNCTSDKWLVGAGFNTSGDNAFNLVTAAIPNAGSPATWKINLRNPDTVAHDVQVVVVCHRSSHLSLGLRP